MPRLLRHPRQNEIAVHLGKVIRVARQQKNLKAENLAFDLGVTQQTVSNWETGKTLPCMAAMFLLSDLIEVPVSKLFSAAEKALWMQKMKGKWAMQAATEDNRRHAVTREGEE